jgi:mono/diheme cytochrome c family protein
MKSIAFAALILIGVSPAAAQSPDRPAVQRGEAAFKNNGCYGCHIIGKFGTPIGPELTRVGLRYESAYLARWLRDPAQQRPNAHMPALELTEADVQALATYLGSLR